MTNNIIREITGFLNQDNTVNANRHLVHILGLNAAVVFNAIVGKQCYYMERDMLDEEGFFYSTIEDLEESTGLSRNRQRTAINLLTETGLIECRVKGLPARRYFRLCNNPEKLKRLLNIIAEEKAPEAKAEEREKEEANPKAGLQEIKTTR